MRYAIAFTFAYIFLALQVLSRPVNLNVDLEYRGPRGGVFDDHLDRRAGNPPPKIINVPWMRTPDGSVTSLPFTTKLDVSKAQPPPPTKTQRVLQAMNPVNLWTKAKDWNGRRKYKKYQQGGGAEYRNKSKKPKKKLGGK